MVTDYVLSIVVVIYFYTIMNFSTAYLKKTWLYAVKGSSENTRVEEGGGRCYGGVVKVAIVRLGGSNYHTRR